MHILHICSDFSGQRIYNQLITSLDALGIEQTIYVPVRTKEEIGKYKNDNLRNVNYRYSHVLKPYHRALFHLKINKVYNDLIKNIYIFKINKTHAHFLFSDGAVALKVKKNKGIPYVVAIRNTDINLFYKYMPHLRSLALEILKEADQIIFVTPSYRSILLQKYIPAKFRDFIISKIIIIPNGIESFWLENVPEKVKKNDNILKLVYVGDFTRNKNVPTLMKSVKKLNEECINSTLTLVGGGGNGETEIMGMLESGNFDMVKFIGRISSRESLLKIYRSHDIFVMASFKETFGVVYLEAMSQGLPVIYTKGQGIDGYFEEGKIGYSVNPSDISDIINKIKKITINRDCITSNIIKEIQHFNWNQIAQQYFKLYQS